MSNLVDMNKSNVKTKDRRQRKKLCSKCGKSFRDYYNLQRHFSNVHEGDISCMLCDHRSIEKDVNQHYKDVHGIEMDIQTHTFDNENEFSVWKQKLENDTNSKYIKGTVRKNKSGSVVVYFRCHRDGFYHSKGNNIRHLKSIGSNKIDSRCPSYMRMCLTDGRVVLKYVATHVGHTNDLDRLYLTQNDRDEIAKEILKGVPVDDILDKIRSSVDSDNVRRIHLTTRKDISNIITSYGLWSDYKSKIDRKKTSAQNGYTSDSNAADSEETESFNCEDDIIQNHQGLSINNHMSCLDKHALILNDNSCAVTLSEKKDSILNESNGVVIQCVSDETQSQPIITYVLDSCIDRSESDSVRDIVTSNTIDIKPNENGNASDFHNFNSDIIIEVEDSFVGKNDLKRKKSIFLDKIHKMLDSIDTNEDMESVLRHAAPLDRFMKCLKNRESFGDFTHRQNYEAEVPKNTNDGIDTIESMELQSALDSEVQSNIAYEVVIE